MNPVSKLIKIQNILHQQQQQRQRQMQINAMEIVERGSIDLHATTQAVSPDYMRIHMHSATAENHTGSGEGIRYGCCGN